MALHINRTAELGSIREVLGRKDPAAHFIAVEAGENMGKTAMQIELLQNESIDARRVRIDLEGLTSIDSILSALAAQLRAVGIRTDKYAMRLEELVAPPRVDIRRVRLRQTSLRISSNSYQDAVSRREILLEQLVADLQADCRKSTLILVDSYDRVGEECRSWLPQVFVPRLMTVPRLVLVVAGRETRRLTDSQGRATVLQLPPFRSKHVADWMRALAATYPPTTLEAVAGALCFVGQGNPADIGGILAGLKCLEWKCP
ncbi:hypothetical protein Val02_32600 [Virgisporangium aliadipatigenens]|uniref:Uncharacterized protein n=1 Tax=Virgisporangium aliadipatigenens TaxID=741659 RepID=A0A8J4DQ98_9ACTN|nr:hypothetical protein [Virgisporangium aliadipatigenens]GIJ46374.1 hypothetical protein Val02_32600 [Virgisporangium aliadipatigenens]